MHIPKGASQTCALLTFDDALHCTEHDDYDAARWLYVPPYYTEYRYILGTRGENPLICIGINPSTAPASPGSRKFFCRHIATMSLATNLRRRWRKG